MGIDGTVKEISLPTVESTMADSNINAPDQQPRGRVCAGLWFVLRLVCVAVAATAILPLLPVDTWWIRIGDFPRLQLLTIYVAMLVVLLPYRRKIGIRWWVMLLVSCCLIQVVKIFPWLPIAPYEVQTAESADPNRRLRILSANVLQDNDQYDRLLQLIDQEAPDVVVIVEVNDRWIDQLHSLERQYAYHEIHPLENKYGIALYSRLPLVAAKVRYLISDEIPSMDVSIALRSGHQVRLFAVHPNPPRPGEHTTKRDGELVLVGREIATAAEPNGSKPTSAVVLGDLNDVGWSRTTNLFQEVSGLLDPRKGRGIYPTFNAHSWCWRYPLDHLFHSDDFRVAEIRTLPDIGSDHFPLLVELSHEPSAAEQQEAPDLDAGDRDDADAAVEDAKAAAKDEGAAVTD